MNTGRIIENNCDVLAFRLIWIFHESFKRRGEGYFGHKMNQREKNTGLGVIPVWVWRVMLH